METGHLEIMATLESLCKPDPQRNVPFEPVRDKLIDLYGAAADHYDIINAFKLTMEAGGAGSLHLSDLRDFTTIFVNQRVYKLPFSVYAVVAQYPQKYPMIKNAILTWAWKQPPIG